MPVVGDILSDLARAKVFSVFDLKSGCWQIQFDEQSSYLTAMGTLFERFVWRRLLYGIALAPVIFHRKLDEILLNLAGVNAVVDDLLVYGEGDTLSEARTNHDQRLVSLLEKARMSGLRFNATKFIFRLAEVPFVGHR